MSFRREAHVPRGGPDGGDGGHGGEVVLVCDDSLRDLQSFKRRAHYKADRGRHGEGSQRHGADGGDLLVRVPPGTVATLEDGTVARPCRARPARRRRPGRQRRARQQPLRVLDPPGAALRRARAARARGLDRAAAQAAGRRRPRRPAERRQVLAAVAHDARRAEDRQLPVHDAGAGPRHARGRRSAS